MIPKLLALRRAADYVERRYGWDDGPDDRTLFECYWEVIELKPTEREEPGALFFVFSRAEYRLGRSWRVLSRLLAENQARALNLRLAATRAEVEQLRDAVADGKARYEEVRDWFTERLVTF